MNNGINSNPFVHAFLPLGRWLPFPASDKYLKKEKLRKLQANDYCLSLCSSLNKKSKIGMAPDSFINKYQVNRSKITDLQ